MPRSIAIGVLALVVLSMIAGGSATAQSDEPKLTIEWADTSSGTAIVTLSNAPNGVSGYVLSVGVTDSSTTIESIEPVDPFGSVGKSEVSDDGTYATAKYADALDSVTAGATNVELARVTLSGADTSTAPPLGIAYLDIQNEDGPSVEPTHDLETLETETETQTPTPADTDDSSGGISLVAVVVVIAAVAGLSVLLFRQ